MSKPQPDADATLHKLGQHLRKGWAKQEPSQEKLLESVKETVREQWEKEQNLNRENQLSKDPDKDKTPKPPGMDMDR